MAKRWKGIVLPDSGQQGNGCGTHDQSDVSSGATQRAFPRATSVFSIRSFQAVAVGRHCRRQTLSLSSSQSANCVGRCYRRSELAGGVEVMALSTGTKLGSYEILAAIGAGGMGEVYRARDAKLGRDVALKVLPEAFARDPERMARFQREAKVLASLNHPNIATIYGLEDSGTTHALVMELVEGPTLADRIGSGPIPISEALPIAKQMCEALEYAHERGIVHRDLKPANVKVTNDDAVKVLDFGLAKALEGDASSIDIANSPTVSRMATQAGVLLGTAAYMSPEQAKGKQ